MNGYGVAGLVSGLAQGYSLGRKIRGDWDEAKVKEAAAEGLEQAKAKRQADINASMTPVETGTAQGIRQEAAALQQQPGTNPAASEGIMMQRNPEVYSPGEPKINTEGPLAGAGLPKKSTVETGKYTVGGKEYGSRDDALKAAEANADSVMNYFNKTAGPKIQEMLLSQGKVEQAKEWGEYLEDGATKQGMKHWAQGLAHVEAGNFEKAAEALTKAQNVQGYGTGLKIAEIKPRKAADGTTQGVSVVYEGEDGKKSSRDFASMEELTTMGVAALNPSKQFEYWVAQKKKADELRADAAKEKAKDTRDANKQARDFTYDVGKMRVKGSIDRENKVEELNTRARLGVGEGGSGVRAAMSDRDAYMQIYNSLMTNDMRFARLPPDQQDAIVKQRLSALPPPARGGLGGTSDSDGVPLLKP